MYFCIFCMYYFVLLYFQQWDILGGRELKRASVPVWGSLLPLKRTNQRFSYFMRSLPAVSLSLYQFATWEAKFLSLTHSWCTVHHLCTHIVAKTYHSLLYQSWCTLHHLCTHIVVGTDSSLLYPPLVHTPLWSKQTTHFDTIHGAQSYHNTIVGSESDQNRPIAFVYGRLVSVYL